MPGRIELPNRFPLYSPFSSRSNDVPLTKDSRLINGFVELDTSDKEYWVYKRPCIGPSPRYQLSKIYGPQVGRGIYQSPAWAQSVSTLISVFGTQLFVGNSPVSNGVPLDNAGGVFSFESVTLGNGVTAVVLHDQARLYLLTQSFPFPYTLQDISANTPTFAQPGTGYRVVPGWAYLDETLYCMDFTGNIFGSALNDPTTWDPLNVIAASSNADQGVALAKQLNYVIAFKQYTTQVFFDNANPAPGSPLSPVPDSQIPLGCYAAHTVRSLDNTLFWMSANESASPQIVQMDNLVPKIVSTPAVERIISQFNNGFVSIGMQNDTFGWTYKTSGHRFYGVTSRSLNLTLVYDMDQLAWYIWTDSSGESYFPIVGTSYQGAVLGGVGGPQLCQHTMDGNIYLIDEAAQIPNDLGQLVPVDIYTPNFDGKIDKSKMLNLLRLNSDQTSGSVLNARYNDNDYDPASWSNFRNIDLSQERPFIDNEGSFYRRAYHFRHRCNTALRIKSGDLLLGIGSL